MYDAAFCKVYNEFGWNYYPEVFGEQLLQWLSSQQLQPRSCMDLACGTGILCRLLQAHGIEASGMDFSAGMIELARQNAPGLPGSRCSFRSGYTKPAYCRWTSGSARPSMTRSRSVRCCAAAALN